MQYIFIYFFYESNFLLGFPSRIPYNYSVRLKQFWGISGQDGGVGRNSSVPRTTKRITTNLKINKQPEVPENQTAWNSNNQGIKETVNQTNQTNQTGKMGSWREPSARWQTVGRAG